MMKKLNADWLPSLSQTKGKYVFFRITQLGPDFQDHCDANFCVFFLEHTLEIWIVSIRKKPLCRDIRLCVTTLYTLFRWNKCDFDNGSRWKQILDEIFHLKAPSVSAASSAAAADSNSSGLMPMASCISVVAAVMKSSSMWRPRPCSRNTLPTSSRAGLRDFWPLDISDLRQ